MNATKKVLAVRNVEQQALMLELDGQISDGFWENAKPNDHYLPWCEAEVVVDPANVGRNFSVRKDNYNFSAKELLDVVGLRMLATVRIARKFGIGIAEILEHASTCEGTVERETWNADAFKSAANHADDGSSNWSLDYFMQLLDEAVADQTYTMSDMRRDLNDLKAIVRERKAA